MDENIDLLINRNKFSRTQINNFKQRDQIFKQSLNSLKKQLELLEDGVLDEYKIKINEIENECKDRLHIIQSCYETKKYEIESQYEMEYRNSVNEYQTKRKELKDNLRNEYEDKRKLVENEKNSLDINMDITDAKPTVTRKLRRRNNEQTPISAAASNLSLLTTINHPTQNSTIAITSSQVSSTIQQSNFYSQSVPSYVLNERKRRPSPAAQIACSLNDEEINDDLKYLNKNFTQLPQQLINSLNELTQQQSIYNDDRSSPIIKSNIY
jgi:hypothetical protein